MSVPLPGSGGSCESRCPGFCSGPGPRPASGLVPKGHPSKRMQKRPLLEGGSMEEALGWPGSRSSFPLFQSSNLNFLKHFLPLSPYPLSSCGLLLFPRRDFLPLKMHPFPPLPLPLAVSHGVLRNFNITFLPGKAPRKRRPCVWAQRLRREPGPMGGRARISFFVPWLKTTLDTVSFS